jgi:UDP-glucuronate 4-epimerase
LSSHDAPTHHVPPRHRVLVTGVAGFIGSQVAEGLLRDGHEVVGVDGFLDSYPRALKEANLGGLLGSPGFRFVELDLRTDDVRPWLDGVDVVVNEAALAGLPRSWFDVRTYIDCNLLALSRLVDACREADVSRFVQASTSSVYGTEAVGDEERPTRPVSPYGVTKLAAEHLLLANHEVHGFPVTILRYFSIYGPRQRPDMAYHIFIEQLRAGQPLTVYGDGRQSRSNTYVDDGVAATIAAIDGAEVGEIYNVGGGQELELGEAIELLGELVGVTPRIHREPARPGDQRQTVADVSKARETFGYEPQTAPRTGLERQVAWHETRAEDTVLDLDAVPTAASARVAP